MKLQYIVVLLVLCTHQLALSVAHGVSTCTRLLYSCHDVCQLLCQELLRLLVAAPLLLQVHQMPIVQTRGGVVLWPE